MWLLPCIYSAFAVRRPPFQAPFPRSISPPPPPRGKARMPVPVIGAETVTPAFWCPLDVPYQPGRCQRVLAVLGSADSGLYGHRLSTVLGARSTRLLPPVSCLSCLSCLSGAPNRKVPLDGSPIQCERWRAQQPPPIHAIHHIP